MRFTTISILILRAIGVFGLVLSPSFGQLDKLNLGKPQDIAPRPLALGGAYTALADDYSAIYYNAAALGNIKKNEFHLSLDQRVLDQSGRSGVNMPVNTRVDEIRVQSCGAVFPFPLKSGGMSIALGFYRPRDFSEQISYDDNRSATRGTYLYQAEGSMDQFRAALGIAISPEISVGLAFGLLDGLENISIQDSIEKRYSREYSGYNIEPSLLLRSGEHIRFGISLVAMERLRVTDTYQSKNGNPSEQRLKIENPFQAKMGLAWMEKDYNISADYKISNWSQYRYALETSSFLENPGYQNEYTLAVGAERWVNNHQTVLRTGYQYNTLSDLFYNPEFNVHKGSVGLGFQIGKNATVDLAYALSFWEMQDGYSYVENRSHRGMLGFGFKF